VKLRNPQLIRWISRAIAYGGRGLFATARIELLSAAPHTLPNDRFKESTHLYCAWHDSIAGLLFYGPCLRMAGLTSRHADGSIVSEIMSALHIKPVRGSTHRGGAAAVAELIETLRDHDVAITPDGPRGPRRELKDGIIFLASVTGVPIVPVTFSCADAWRPRGRWTDMTVPKPLARGWLMCGVPIDIPNALSRNQFREYRDLLQQVLDKQQEFSDALASRTVSRIPGDFAHGAFRSEDDTPTSWRSLGIECEAECRPALRVHSMEHSSANQAA
jgi:lysophospholipid acyltransferase (LPLAT)-like uncharacterized protein